MAKSITINAWLEKKHTNMDQECKIVISSLAKSFAALYDSHQTSAARFISVDPRAPKSAPSKPASSIITVSHISTRDQEGMLLPITDMKSPFLSPPPISEPRAPTTSIGPLAAVS